MYSIIQTARCILTIPSAKELENIKASNGLIAIHYYYPWGGPGSPLEEVLQSGSEAIPGLKIYTASLETVDVSPELVEDGIATTVLWADGQFMENVDGDPEGTLELLQSAGEVL